MECYVCSRHSPSETGLCCPACARNALYPYRIDFADRLLEKIKLGQQVQAIIETPHGSDSAINEATRPILGTYEGRKQRQHEWIVAELTGTRDRIDGIVRQSEALQSQVDKYKKALATQRAALAARRSDLVSASTTFNSFQSTSVKVVTKAISKVKQRHVLLYNELISSRAYLCREAALLAGLCRRRAADFTLPDTYTLGGVVLMDIRRLNEYKPGEISAALTSITQLLFLVCYYLGIRLPAELVIPGEHRPLPTIHQLSSSYRDQEVLDNSTTPATDAGLFGLAHSTHADKSTSRARPLWPDQKLPVLARDDPNQYLKFVQGVALLAWDVAWVCRSQGIDVASGDWEEVCAIGRNLWLLLVSPPAPSTLSKKQEREHVELGSGAVQSPAARTQAAAKDASPTLGLLSHATSGAFLGNASSTSPNASSGALGRPWKYASPVPIMINLKAYLLAEMSGLEWEVLDQTEYDNARGVGIDETDILDHRASMDTTVGPDGSDGNDERRAKGTSGWTKLKSRTSS